MKSTIVGVAVVAGILAVTWTAAAADVPEKYVVAVEFTPGGDAAPVKAELRCRRAETCSRIMKLPINGKERTAMLASRVADTDVLDLELIPWANDRGTFEGAGARYTYEPNASFEQQIVKVNSVDDGKTKYGMPKRKRVETPVGRVRFTMTGG